MPEPPTNEKIAALQQEIFAGMINPEEIESQFGHSHNAPLIKRFVVGSDIFME